MRVLLSITAALAFLAGALTLGVSSTAIHEIMAACYFLIFAVAGSGVAICEHISRLRSEAEKQTAMLEKIARYTKPPEPAITTQPATIDYLKEPHSSNGVTVAIIVGIAIVVLMGLYAASQHTGVSR